MLVGHLPWWAPRRTRDRAAAGGGVAAREQIVAARRPRGKKARIMLRGDRGFCRAEIRVWGARPEAVYYCLGLAKNDGLLRQAARALVAARARRCLTGAPQARTFTEFDDQPQKSWRRERRGMGKAEVMAAGAPPRFSVTPRPATGFKDDEAPTRFTPARLYEPLYGARGAMENVLQQRGWDLPADRMSPHYLAGHQRRLGLGTGAYLLMERGRALGWFGPELAQATVGSVRLKWWQGAARVTVRGRRVTVPWSSAYPLAPLFRLGHRRLMALAWGSDERRPLTTGSQSGPEFSNPGSGVGKKPAKRAFFPAAQLPARAHNLARGKNTVF